MKTRVVPCAKVLQTLCILACCIAVFDRCWCIVWYLHLGIHQRLSLVLSVLAAAEAHRLPEGDARVAEPLQAVLELQDIPPHQERHRSHGLGARRDRTQAGAPSGRASGERLSCYRCIRAMGKETGNTS